MRLYTFAHIADREYPTLHLLDHPYIWGGVRFCVNVSEKPYSTDVVEAMAEHGIDWIHCPVSEEPGSNWRDSLLTAIPQMITAYHSGWKQIVHCDFGNNRSRTFVEAFYYCLKDEHLEDPYKGEMNHLAYNCRIGQLPPLDEMEPLLLSFAFRGEEPGRIP